MDSSMLHQFITAVQYNSYSKSELCHVRSIKVDSKIQNSICYFYCTTNYTILYYIRLD